MSRTEHRYLNLTNVNSRGLQAVDKSLMPIRRSQQVVNQTVLNLQTRLLWLALPLLTKTQATLASDGRVPHRPSTAFTLIDQVD